MESDEDIYAENDEQSLYSDDGGSQDIQSQKSSKFHKLLVLGSNNKRYKIKNNTIME